MRIDGPARIQDRASSAVWPWHRQPAVRPRWQRSLALCAAQDSDWCVARCRRGQAGRAAGGAISRAMPVEASCEEGLHCAYIWYLHTWDQPPADYLAGLSGSNSWGASLDAAAT
jgi:hypothetical protein